MLFGLLGIFIVLCVLLVCFSVGTVVSGAVKRIYKSEKDTDLLLLPLIGASVIVCFFQFFNLFLPIKAVSLAVLPFFVFSLYLFRHELKNRLSALLKHKTLLVTCFISAFLILLPFTVYEQMISLNFGNNDIIYYLADMEWLKDNSYFDNISYDAYHPYTSLAAYMKDTTRIGTDIFGAVILSFTGFEPHQIYWPMTAFFSVLCVFAVTWLCKNVLDLKGGLTDVFILFLGTGTGIAELVRQQYAPQIFGISMFIVFFGLTYRFWFDEKKDALSIILPAVMLAGIFAVYCEYLTYTVAVFGIAFIISCFCLKDAKKIFSNILSTVYMLVLTAFLNIPGFVKAVRFNLDILLSNLGDLGNIDPYGGNIIDIKKFLYYFFNFSPNVTEDKIFIGKFAIPAFIFMIAKIIIPIMVLVLFAAMIVGIVKKHGVKEIYLLSSLAFFGIYWIFFRLKRYAYGEFKHLHLVMWLCFVIAFYFVYHGISALLSKKAADVAPDPTSGDSPSENKVTAFIKKRYSIFGKTASAVLLSALILTSMVNVCVSYDSSRSDFTFGNNIAALETAVNEHIPKDEVIGIFGNWYYENHAILYAIRNTGHTVSLMTKDSYYAFFVSYLPYIPNYIIFSVDANGRYGDALNTDDYQEIYRDRSFCIMERTKPFGAIISYGFGSTKVVSDSQRARVLEPMSEIFLFNHSDAEKQLVLSFKTVSDGDPRTFEVKIGDEVIGTGTSSEEFVTLPLSVAAGSKLDINIVLSENGGSTAIYDIRVTEVQQTA